MRIALIFAIFAPIQLCSFGRNEPFIRFDTWSGPDSGVRQDASVGVDSPLNNTIVEPGEQLDLVGSADFVGAFPEEVRVLWIRPDQSSAMCSGNLDFNGTHRCIFTVPEAWTPGSYRIQFRAEAPWGQVQDAFVSLVIEEEEPEPVAPPVLTIGSPAPSSSWSEANPVPFVATLAAGSEPVTNARVVWEVDGLQVSALTARTDDAGTVVRAALFDVGPHEALATVFVDDVLITASTRFVVTADDDPDADSDSDSEAASER